MSELASVAVPREGSRNPSYSWGGREATKLYITAGCYFQRKEFLCVKPYTIEQDIKDNTLYYNSS